MDSEMSEVLPLLVSEDEEEAIAQENEEKGEEKDNEEDVKEATIYEKP